MKLSIKAALCGVAALAIAGPASAHFILVAPDSAVVENVLGDPQKAAPCGLSEITSGTPTGKITEMKGGEMQFAIMEEDFALAFDHAALLVERESELMAKALAARGAGV